MNKLVIALTIALVTISPVCAQDWGGPNTSSPQFMMGSLDGLQRAAQSSNSFNGFTEVPRYRFYHFKCWIHKVFHTKNEPKKPLGL